MIQKKKIKGGFLSSRRGLTSPLHDSQRGRHSDVRQSNPCPRVRSVSARAGFTLIELLVVIAVIAMVLSVMVIQFQAYRTRVRDVQRERNMSELQKALELYVTAKRVFPEGVNTIITGIDPLSAILVSADVIPVVPPDPLNSGVFIYTYDSPTGKTYTLRYTLETDSIPGKAKGPQVITP